MKLFAIENWKIIFNIDHSQRTVFYYVLVLSLLFILLSHYNS